MPDCCNSVKLELFKNLFESYEFASYQSHGYVFFFNTFFQYNPKVDRLSLGEPIQSA